MTTSHFPDPCTCQPGTAANGWHEVRCDACRAVERADWARAVAAGDAVAQRILAERRVQH